MARGTPPTIIHQRTQQKAGDCTAPFLAALTASEGTTTPICMAGWTHGRILNISGASITVTYYDARTAGGNALTTYDEDAVAVAAQTVPNNASMALPSGLAGVTWLIPVLSSGTASVYFTFAR